MLFGLFCGLYEAGWSRERRADPPPASNCVLVAKQAAEVDILSGGRLRLGVGTGWNYVEYDSLNERFTNRGRRQVEQVELLRKLWQEPVRQF